MAELFGKELYEAQNDARPRVPRREEGGASAPPTYEQHIAEYHGATPPLSHSEWLQRQQGPQQYNEVPPPVDTSSAVYFCAEAARLVGGPRAATHGDKTINFQNIAELWNGYWRIKCRLNGEKPTTPFTPHDVGCFMELFKIARRFSGNFNADDYIDAAGYAGCAGEIAAKDAANGKTQS